MRAAAAQAALRAEREQKAAAKAERRAAKAERRAAKMALASGDGQEEEEEEEMDDDDDDDESEDEAAEDDSEQVFEDTMAKCSKLASKLRSTLSSLVQADGAAPPLPQPPNMSPTLAMAPHQLVGLSWLHGLHRHGASGILADEMGLGKTVQAISLLAHLLSEGDAGPHMVVAPASTLDNWQREFEMWCPALRVLKYHGSEADRTQVCARAAE